MKLYAAADGSAHRRRLRGERVIPRLQLIGPVEDHEAVIVLLRAQDDHPQGAVAGLAVVAPSTLST